MSAARPQDLGDFSLPTPASPSGEAFASLRVKWGVVAGRTRPRSAGRATALLLIDVRTRLRQIAVTGADE